MIYLFQHHRRRAAASVLIEESRFEAESSQTAIIVARRRAVPEFERDTDFVLLRDESGIQLWERDFNAA